MDATALRAPSTFASRTSASKVCSPAEGEDDITHDAIVPADGGLGYPKQNSGLAPNVLRFGYQSLNERRSAFTVMRWVTWISCSTEAVHDFALTWKPDDGQLRSSRSTPQNSPARGSRAARRPL